MLHHMNRLQICSSNLRVILFSCVKVPGAETPGGLLGANLTRQLTVVISSVEQINVPLELCAVLTCAFCAALKSKGDLPISLGFVTVVLIGALVGGGVFDVVHFFSPVVGAVGLSGCPLPYFIH